MFKPALSIDNAGLNMNGHIIIRDKETGEEIINKRNAIHYGNMARIVAQALNNTADSYINFIAFGNGGTSVDSSGGKVIYRSNDKLLYLRYCLLKCRRCQMQ